MTLCLVLRFAKVLVVVNRVDYSHANMDCAKRAENMEEYSNHPDQQQLWSFTGSNLCITDWERFWQVVAGTFGTRHQEKNWQNRCWDVDVDVDVAVFPESSTVYVSLVKVGYLKLWMGTTESPVVWTSGHSILCWSLDTPNPHCFHCVVISVLFRWCCQKCPMWVIFSDHW